MRILVVDDDRDYLGLLASQLQARGHDVISAVDGKEARELLDVEHADLVVSDVSMPTLDGIWLHSYVRDFSDEPDTPFVYVTTPGDGSTGDLVVDPRIDLVLKKATETEELVRRIESFVKTGKAKPNPAGKDSRAG